MFKLGSLQRRELRARAHHLHPVVSIAAKGLSDTVVKEIDRSLKAHELIKVRVYGEERSERAAMMEKLCEKLECAPVQLIGNLLVLYRPGKDETSAATPSAQKRTVATNKISKPRPSAAAKVKQARSKTATSALARPRTRAAGSLRPARGPRTRTAN